MFKDVTRNLGRVTDTLVSLVGALKRDVVGAVRDMMREESVTQVCAQRPGPPAREQPPTVPASEKKREESAPPARVDASTLGTEARGGTGVWPAVECKTLTPVGVRHADDTRLDPNVSCLAQRLVATLYSNVGPAMIRSLAAAERIPKFSDEEKGTVMELQLVVT